MQRGSVADRPGPRWHTLYVEQVLYRNRDAVEGTHCRAADARFVCRTPFAPGDLVIFDNRRILHGRDAFVQGSGARRLEGCYLETDELLSRLRVLSRETCDA